MSLTGQSESVQHILPKGDLGIYVITYNRAKELAQTLEYIVNSALRDFPITVLDNCSTDNSVEIARGFAERIPDLRVISNRYNVGLGANFLKTFDLGDYKYTWVLCDDDKIDAPRMDDVLQVISEGEVELIHVGAHPQDRWSFGGKFNNPKQLLAGGYPYFKFSSFIPCNIFRTDAFVKSIIAAYENVVNAYPHMPFLFNIYLTDKLVYISNKQLVIAQPSDSGYNAKTWYKWWMKTCELLADKKDVRLAYLDQWKNDGHAEEEEGLKSILCAEQVSGKSPHIRKFVSRYFTVEDKFKLLAIRATSKTDELRGRLYWFRKGLMKRL